MKLFHIATAISLYGVNCELLTFKLDFNYADTTLFIVMIAL